MVDFSVVDAEEIARNCTTRGGKVEIKSRERAVQEQRELTTLMVFYTYLSDVPPTPREPADPYTGDTSVELEFGRPSDETKVPKQTPHLLVTFEWLTASAGTGSSVLRRSESSISFHE